MRPARRSAGCCGPGTPARTRPWITWSCSTWRSRRVPAEYIETIEILVRADSAGATHAPAGLLPRGAAAVLGRLRADRAGPLSDPPDPRGRVGGGARSGRIGARERRGRRDHRAWSSSSALARRIPADRAPRAPAPRRAALVHRPRRLPLPGDPHRPDRQGHRRDRVPPPPARACRGPHP